MQRLSVVIIRSLVILFLLLPSVSPADDQNSKNSTTPKETSRQSGEIVDELLLFREEKDLFVETPTRHAKPLSQTAENITVITAKEIEDINAHTVAEALQRIAGVFVDYKGQDFGSSSLLYIQGSEERHVLVVVDGIVWNFLGGNAETNSIPINIIERIEVIKGPASSAWGSSLGGVINIITKHVGTSLTPSGTISSSFGERGVQDYRAEASGRTSLFGYFTAISRQDSSGLRDGRYFEKNSLYTKVNVPLSGDAGLRFSVGYSEPRLSFGDLPSSDLTSRGMIRTFFATSSFDTSLANGIDLSLSIYTFKQKYVQMNNVLGLGINGEAGSLFENIVYNEQTTSGNAKLVWRSGIHNAVFGLDMSHSKLEQMIDAGDVLQSYGGPATISTNPGITRWAVYANDTINSGSFTLIPGVRYDYSNITGSFVSPSLGATYRPTKLTIFRLSASRGFTVPPLSWTNGGGLFLDPNPDLKAEKVWSYQAGVESNISDLFWIKSTLFRHQVSDILNIERGAGGPPAYNDMMFNKGSGMRQGVEVEVETAPYNRISLKAGAAYITKRADSDADSTVNYSYAIGVKYDDRKSFMTQLSGRYVWWDMQEIYAARYNTFIWDLNLRKKLYSEGRLNTEIFFTGHNLFSGSQYAFSDMINPGRWVEAGVRVKF